MSTPQTAPTAPALVGVAGVTNAVSPAGRSGLTALDAAWIRDNVWTPAMRKQFTEVPGFYLLCACQYGPTTSCREGQHQRCHRAEPLRSDETYILKRGGIYPAYFAEPYAHKTDTSATGPQFTSAAQVWLADRVCRWVCPCGCGHDGKRVMPDQGAGDDGASRPIANLQLDLFGELVSA